MSDKNSKIAKEGFFEVTEADYQEQLAEGIEEEFLIKPGRYKFFRGQRADIHPETIQTTRQQQELPSSSLCPNRRTYQFHALPGRNNSSPRK